MFKPLAAAALAFIFVSSTAAIAADNQGALAPGKAASVKKAQLFQGGTGLYVLGAGVLIGGLALTLSGNGKGSVGATTTCPVSGCTSSSGGGTTTTATTTTP